MSSSTSKISESVSDSKDLHEQSPTYEAPEQSKDGGGKADHIGGRVPEAAAASSGGEGEGDGSEDGEEEGECGFCLFMKGGGCRDAFTEWEKCVEEAEKTEDDIVEKCFQVTANLKKCMEAHADYYEPILRAEKAAEAEVSKELQGEAEVKSEEPTATSDSNPDPEISKEQVKS